MPSNRFEKRKENTQKRYAVVKQKVNELYSQTLHGIRLDYDGVIKKVAEDYGYSERTLKNILKAN